MSVGTYTLTQAMAWAVVALNINPVGAPWAGPPEPVSGALWSGPSSGGTTWTLPALNSGSYVGVAVVAGDLLIAAINCEGGGGQSVSAPAGWTLAGTVTGAGTEPSLLTVFYKIAVAGDITAGITFTFANSLPAGAGRAGGGITVLTDGTFDATTPVLGVFSSASSGDSTPALGPDLLGLPTEFFVAEFIGICADDSDIGMTAEFEFLYQPNTGTGWAGSPPFGQILSFRITPDTYTPAAGGVSINRILSG